MNTTSTEPKHGLADRGYRPERADWTIDQGWAHYTPQDHAVWKTLFERQTGLLPGRACEAFVQGMRALPMRHDQIPRFDELSEALMKRTGWQVVAVPGLVPDEVFFDHLAHRRFPSGRFIRRPDELDYLEEPDVFHDVFGHVPMLM
ncbi:MAG TPA: phenylalanine 4-monooxygenase, partial [Ottowia sp.]|nr:phenylalanine 4-monooxygenase [Ottowia sp.]